MGQMKKNGWLTVLYGGMEGIYEMDLIERKCGP
jgi:hypothetical protein